MRQIFPVVARGPVVVVVVGEAAEVEGVRHGLPSIALRIVGHLDDRGGRRRVGGRSAHGQWTFAKYW